MNLTGVAPVSESATLTRYVVDADHSNAYEAWKRMGSPLPLSTAQSTQLEEAGKLATVGAPETVSFENGTLKLTFPLPRQAVMLLVFQRHQTSQ